ncbi:MAG: Uma2 family endonuclease [Acidimicrobiales bacterium]
MRSVMLETPEALLEERRKLDMDLFDEMWEGELHMVPPPSGRHQEVALALLRTFLPLAEARGLVARFETGLFRPGVDNDWRVPDQTYTRPETLTERGIDGPASLVVEFLSPNDETYKKMGFYASLGVTEALVVNPRTRQVEVLTRQGDQMVGTGGLGDAATVATLGVKLALADGRLMANWEDGSAEI